MERYRGMTRTHCKNCSIIQPHHNAAPKERHMTRIDWLVILSIGAAFGCLLAGWPFYGL